MLKLPVLLALLIAIALLVVALNVSVFSSLLKTSEKGGANAAAGRGKGTGRQKRPTRPPKPLTWAELPPPETEYCPPVESAENEASGFFMSEDYCSVLLPDIAPQSTSALLKRAREMLEGEDSIFPFISEHGYNITEEEGMAVEMLMLEKTPPPVSKEKDRMPSCGASTYDGHNVDRIGEMFLPGGTTILGVGDEVVDLGAGIAKVLAIVALTTNATGRGIEFVPERFKVGCDVLRLLGMVFEEKRRGIAASRPRPCPGWQGRRFQFWRGDLYQPPAKLLEFNSLRVTFFAYATCFPYSLVTKMMEMIVEVEHPKVRLVTTKEPIGADRVPSRLRRKHGGLFTMYVKDVE
eukprot:gnl/MRDRNA2_/MRDRNA2_165938_c0_seq1.p1 gnl/MRDRNA2_/MRDRNA2_165938_c0~~gnl/MRDRNA2_/MRDRNA2_165938_c0_seq1.p1  ORF type:complete len:350 (-),score=67.34 gnl/MRDRNA2_/MRDRNA2_165938_c0_seq1:25-1074(-)